MKKLLLSVIAVFACAMGWCLVPNPTWIRTAAQSNWVMDTYQNKAAIVTYQLVSIVDMSTGQTKVAHWVGAGVRDVSFSGDGLTFAVSTSSADNVVIVNATTGAVETTIDMGGALGPALRAKLFRKGATSHLLTIHDNAARLWTKSGVAWTPAFTWTSLGACEEVAVKPNGSEWAMLSYSTDSLWTFSLDTLSNTPSRDVNRSVYDGDDLCYSSNGAALATASWGDGVSIYETTNYQKTGGFDDYSALAVRFAPDGNTLWVNFVNSNRRIGQFNLNGGLLWATSSSDDDAFDLAVTQSGKVLVSSAQSPVPAVLDSSGITTTAPLLNGRVADISSVDSFRMIFSTEHGWLSMLNTATGAIEKNVYSGSEQIRDVAASNSAKRIAVSTSNIASIGGLRILDFNLNPIAMAPFYEDTTVHRVAFSPSKVGGKDLLAYTDGTVCEILNAANGAVLKTFFTANEVHAIAFSRDGTRFALGTSAGGIGIYRTDTWTSVSTLSVGADVLRLMFGRTTDRLIAFRNNATTTMVPMNRTAVGDSWVIGSYTDLPGIGAVNEAEVSPDGNTILVTDQNPLNNRILMIDTASLAVIQDIVGGPFTSSPPGGGACDLAYGADGAMIVQGLMDNYVFGAYPNPSAVFVDTVSWSANPVNRGTSTVLTIRFSRPAVAGTTITLSYPSTKLTGPVTITPTVGARLASATINVAPSAAVGQYPITITLGRTVKPKLTVQ